MSENQWCLSFLGISLVQVAVTLEMKQGNQREKKYMTTSFQLFAKLLKIRGPIVEENGAGPLSLRNKTMKTTKV